MKTIWLILFVLILVSFNCCKDDPVNEVPQPTLNIVLDEPTEISETAVTISWKVNRNDISSLSINLAGDYEFTKDVKNIAVNNPLQETMVLKDLKGAKKYFYKIVVMLNDGSISESDVKIVVTSHTREEISFLTSDSLTIRGDLQYLKSNSSPKPGIVFMHQFQRVTNEWITADVTREFISQGYVCLTFDFRGHGKSDKWDINFGNDVDEFTKRIKEYVEKYAYKDMFAAIEFLNTNEKVEKDKIALIGASLGANCAINGNDHEAVKAAIPLSPSTVAILSGLKMQNIFFIVGDKDKSSSGGPDYAKDTKILYDSAKEPKKLLVLPNEPGHGWEYLGKENVNEQIVEWINSRMAD